jgi:hypothetical protein
MADDFAPLAEGQRIARTYLSKRGWARERRRALNTQLYPGFLREELEEKQRECDLMEDDAEAYFSSEYEKWRKEDSPAGREVRRGLFQLLGPRKDLGFIGQRIVDRLRREFTLQ